MHRRACMRVSAFVCVRVHIIDKDDLVHKLRYDAINKLYHIIYLSFRISLYLPTYIRTHTHTHIHTVMCVCVCCVFGCSHIRRRKEFYLSKALTHSKIERLIDSYRYTDRQEYRQTGRCELIDIHLLRVVG